MADTESSPRHQAVIRAEGITRAERYLQRLCERSFLTLWSYPGVFRDQKTGGKGDGKELCDLLVVFGDDVLVFSDKSCSFPATGNPQLDWSRWFRKAVLKSAEQVWGAERWLRANPNRIFLDRACTQTLPFELPRPDRMRVHRIVVAHNVSDRCAAYFSRGSSGTLVFSSDLSGKDHYADSGTCRPFEVGWLDPDRGFVHVLDDMSLEILLGTRDTITDFCEYLRWKEELLQSARCKGVRFMYCGEEDLVANYLMVLKNGQHGFSIPEDLNAFCLAEGDWLTFQASPQRAAQLEADKISYAWDGLIETFNKNILAGTSYGKATHPLADRERIMRFLGREPRVRRRILADALVGLVEKTRNTQRGIRVMLPSNPGDPYYSFLVLPRLLGRPPEEYREVRGHLLEALCLVTKLQFPDALDIVGIATDAGIDTVSRSEDALYLNARIWSAEMEAHARDLKTELGLLTSVTTFQDKVSEFPIMEQPSAITPGRNPRNKPCPCGSGKKYKKCHGS